MRLIYLPVVVILLAGLLGQSGAPTQSQPRERTHESIDLEFRSGNAMEYVAAIRRQGADVNIVVTDDLRDIAVREISLRNVTIGAALEVIDGNHELSDGRVISVDIKMYRDHPATEPIYLVRSQVAGRSRGTTLMSRVWSLAQPLAGPATADQILTAVEAALALYGTQYPAADLRFHDETSLLIARAHPEQIDTIAAVLGELGRGDAGAGKDAATAAAREQAESMRRAVVDCETRSAIYREEIRDLRTRLAEMEAEARARSMQLRDTEGELRRLQDMLNGRREN
ncbi:MAG: hypothetical protein HKN62_02225 [Phycisphaerales bacterium]|nr:hypothetical protein [Phycisphaerales bacterium]